MELALRVHVLGEVAIESADGRVHRDLPGRLGRVLFVLLVVKRRAVPVDEVVEVLWGTEPPPSWEGSLRALLSTLRGTLGAAGLPAGILEQAQGTVRLKLSGDTWVDLLGAYNGADRAEGALRTGRPQEAFGWAAMASAITRRPFLPGEEGPWIEHVRGELRRVRLRALDSVAEIFLARGQWPVAVKVAEDALAVEPVHELACQVLMRAHAAAGNRAEALLAYHRLRRRLAEDLGVDPSPRTEGVFRDVLAGH